VQKAINHELFSLTTQTNISYLMRLRDQRYQLHIIQLHNKMHATYKVLTAMS